MTEMQKIIKYLAMAFAIFLTITIISGICGAIASFSFLFGDKKVNGKFNNYPVSEVVEELVIDTSIANLTIKTEDEFRIESNHKYLKVKESGGKLKISEKRKWLISNPNGVKLIIYVPEGTHFSEADINTGAGKVIIDTLSADKIDLDLGAGEAQIGKLTANQSIKIDGGAGELVIKEGLLNNLDLDMGVGELDLTGKLLGDCKLDYGIGETNLTLLGSKENYTIALDKGVGKATVDGESMKDESVYGIGANQIDIDGGVGELNVMFQE